jgi:cytochrome P450
MATLDSIVDDGYDPFEAFDRAMGANTVRDPFPTFAEYRRKGPVQRADIRQVMGVSPDVEIPEDLLAFTAVGYDAVMQVLRDGETFSSSGYAASMGELLGHSILEMDEPEHHRYRGLVQQVFTRKAMERWEADIVRPVVSGFLDELIATGNGGGDLVRGLTFPFPVHVIARMLGLPATDLDAFHGRAVAMTNAIDWDRAIEASAWMHDYFVDILDERRRQPGDDIVSVLAAAELDGHRLEDEDIFAFLRLLLPAGAETTYRSSSNLFFALLSNAHLLDAVRQDRTLVPPAIEEGLRWEPPLTGIVRLSMRDTEVCGVTIPAGSVMHVNVASANHDEARWENGEQFDLWRQPAQHMAFAFGPHMCLGMHLARMETAVALNAVLDRLPNLRLDPDAEDVHIAGLLFRAPRALPVLFG